MPRAQDKGQSSVLPPSENKNQPNRRPPRPCALEEHWQVRLVLMENAITINVEWRLFFRLKSRTRRSNAVSP
jgi:hypothetical protein